MNNLKEFFNQFDKNQIEQIRLGFKSDVDAIVYAKPEFDWVQMREIRLGLEKKLRCIYLC